MSSFLSNLGRGAKRALPFLSPLAAGLGTKGGREALFGRSGSNEERSLLTPEQEEVLRFFSQQAQGQPGVDEEFFDRSFVDPAMASFQNRIAPQIQQKFIASGGARGSNVNDSLTRAGADIFGNLSQLRGELLNQALNRRMQAGQLALGTKAFTFEEDPGRQGLIGGLLQGAGSAIGGAFGGPAGAKIGGGIGQGVGEMFNRGNRFQAGGRGFRG